MRIAYCATTQVSASALKSFNLGLSFALKRLLENSGHEFIMITHEDNKDDYQEFIPNLELYSGNNFIYENFSLPGVLKRLEVDLAIFPHNRIPTFQGDDIKKVVVIHDLLVWRFPNKFPVAKRNYKLFMLKNATQKADLIVTVSEFVKKELKAFGYQKEVIVIDEGVDFSSQATNRIDKNPEKDLYYVFLGRKSFQKNIGILFQAFDKVASMHPEVKLILVGGINPKIQPEIEAQFQASKWKNRIEIRGELTESEKNTLIAHAEALVLPSIYEGFGLQMLEAFYHETPVICSNKGALPEIAGDAALVVEPTVDALSQAMLSVVAFPRIADDLKKRGTERLKLYTWQASAEKLFSAISKKFIEKSP